MLCPSMSVEEYIVTLNVSPGLEVEIVDCLLMLESEHGFCTFPIYSHDHRNKGLSLPEQVSGRRKSVFGCMCRSIDWPRYWRN